MIYVSILSCLAKLQENCLPRKYSLQGKKQQSGTPNGWRQDSTRDVTPKVHHYNFLLSDYSNIAHTHTHTHSHTHTNLLGLGAHAAAHLPSYGLPFFSTKKRGKTG